MTRMRRVILLGGLLAVACATATPHAHLSKAAQAAPSPTPVTQPTPDAEVLALRAQVDEMRRSSDRILTTVYWSLGTLAVIAGVLVAYGWFTTFRVYEGDKEEMQRQLREDVTVRADAEKNNAESARIKTERRLREQLDERQRSFNESFGENINATTKHIAEMW